MNFIQQLVENSAGFEIALEITALVATFFIIGPLIERRVQAAERKRLAIENFNSIMTLFTSIDRLVRYALSNYLTLYSKVRVFLHGHHILIVAHEVDQRDKEEKQDFAEWLKEQSDADRYRWAARLEEMSSTKEQVLKLMRDAVDETELALSNSMNEYRGARSEIQALIHRSSLIFANSDQHVRERAGDFVHDLWVYLSDWESIYEICGHTIRTLDHTDVNIPEIYAISAADGANDATIKNFRTALVALKTLGELVQDRRHAIGNSISESDWKKFDRTFAWLNGLEADEDGKA